jgi:hypothetical protein
MTKFPHAMPILLECTRRETQDLFRIGDALIADGCDGSRKMLREAKAELDKRGLLPDRRLNGHKFPTLRQLFDTSVAFPPDRRRDVGWELHAEAGTPDFLDEILRENERTPDTFRKFGGMLGFAKEYAKYQRWLKRRSNQP